jgi:D-sedoheptulose 7-phosphate isomerase
MLEPRIQQQFFEGADLQYQTAEVLARAIAEAARAVVTALTSGGKVLLCGQGGGAWLARHGAQVLVGGMGRERPPLAALAVPVEPLTIQALGLPGDLLVLIAPAAADPEAGMAAVRAAQGKDMIVVLLLSASSSGLRETLAETDVLIEVPHERVSRVLEAQLLALHALCDAVDVQLIGDQE